MLQFLVQEGTLKVGDVFVAGTTYGRVRSCVVLQPESYKSEFLEKALDLQNKLLSLGYEVRVLPQVHKLLGAEVTFWELGKK